MPCWVLLPCGSGGSDCVPCGELLCGRRVCADGVLLGQLLWGGSVCAEAVQCGIVLCERVCGGCLRVRDGVCGGVCERGAVPRRILLREGE